MNSITLTRGLLQNPFNQEPLRIGLMVEGHRLVDRLPLPEWPRPDRGASDQR